MTGTGTETDPFIVGSWSEFVAVNTDNYQKFIKFADSDNKTIDFNDISPAGMDTIVIKNYIDFNDWTLMNFYTESQTALKIETIREGYFRIKNLNFLNFYHRASKATFILLMDYESASSTFMRNVMINCKFSGCVDYSGESYFIRNSRKVISKIIGCSFNIEGKSDNDLTLVLGTSGNPFTDYVAVTCQSVQFKLNLNLASGSICKATVLKECLIDGKINITSEQTEVAMIVGDATSDKVDIGGNNVCLLNANKPIWYYQKGDNILVYDNTQSTFTENSVNAIGCTPAQLTDAEYLSSIGFPIGVD